MEDVTARLAEIYGDRRWILTNTISAGMPRTVRMLEEWNAETMVVAASPGIGDQPEVPTVYTGSSGSTILEGIHDFFARLAEPFPEVAAAVESFDPGGEARVILPVFASDPDVLGRRGYGVRPPQWTALEDKLAVLEIFEDAGIEMAPYRITEVAAAPDIAGEVASELGTVWVADNKKGWHGGAEYLRWVRGSEDHTVALAFFEGKADRVRVMPFLDGLPCSIHGWVGGSTLAVFRPVEILVLRTPEPGFQYAGVSTRWDPPNELREEMRSVARTVGEVLRADTGYRGPFGIDGVATRDGFRPTELNARISTGLGVQLASVDLPLGLVLRAIIEGDLVFEPGGLEDEVVEQADAQRRLSSWIVVPDEHPEQETGVSFEKGWAESVDTDSDHAEGTIELGPSTPGSALMISLDPEKVGVGEPMAPLVAMAAELAVELWGLDIPPLTPAPDLSR